jgi:hypothetical protein
MSQPKRSDIQRKWSAGWLSFLLGACVMMKRSPWKKSEQKAVSDDKD